MVNVTTKGLLDGQFTKLWKDIYVMTSIRKFKDKLPYPKELKPYLDDLYSSYDLSYEFIANKFNISVKGINLNQHDERVVCAFSGGKDSVANVLMLKGLGYKPVLFFTKGVNRSYPHEYEHAVKLAKRLNVEMYTYNLSVSGKCEFFENPTKDQFILALMVDYGLKKNIPNYSFGTYLDANFGEVSADYMLSDGTFMFDNALKFYQSFLPEMDFPMFLECGAHAFYYVVSHDETLLQDIYSCMMPLRYKQNLINNNEKKYGIKLLPDRCGSCYKCCDEALTLNAFGITNYSDDFIYHCKEVIYKFYKQFSDEDGIQAMEKSIYDNEDIFDWVLPEYIDLYNNYKESGIIW